MSKKPLRLDEWLTLDEVEAALPAMRHFDAARVARGDQRSTQTGDGFLPNYRKAKGSKAKMKQRQARSNETWFDRRNNFVKRHMAQARKNRENLFPNGIPSKRMLGLIAWAYVPPEWDNAYAEWVESGWPVNPKNRRNGSTWDHPQRPGSTVQSIIFDRDVWGAREAKQWLREHGYSAPKVDRKPNVLRFRQHDPSLFYKDSFRTIPFGDNTGIQAIVAIPR